MKFHVKKTVKTMAIALALSGTLIGGSVALADSTTGTVTIARDQTKSMSGISVKKTNDTGKAAKITVYGGIPYNDSLSVYVKNKYDNIVSTRSAVFKGTTSTTTESIPYEDGKGKKGNPFYPVFHLSQSSMSSSLTVSFTFQA